MKRVTVVFDITDAWETWEAEVPDETTEDDIRHNMGLIFEKGWHVETGGEQMDISEIEFIEDPNEGTQATVGEEN